VIVAASICDVSHAWYRCEHGGNILKHCPRLERCYVELAALGYTEHRHRLPSHKEGGVGTRRPTRIAGVVGRSLSGYGHGQDKENCVFEADVRIDVGRTGRADEDIVRLLWPQLPGTCVLQLTGQLKMDDVTGCRVPRTRLGGRLNNNVTVESRPADVRRDPTASPPSIGAGPIPAQLAALLPPRQVDERLGNLRRIRRRIDLDVEDQCILKGHVHDAVLDAWGKAQHVVWLEGQGARTDLNLELAPGSDHE
jgi:hypothetical protein